MTPARASCPGRHGLWRSHRPRHPERHRHVL